MSLDRTYSGPEEMESKGPMDVDDMSQMAKMTKESVVENIERRYFRDAIYTSASDVIISV